MKGYSFKIFEHLAEIAFYNDTDEKRDIFDRKWSHYPILHRVLNMMYDRGFQIGRDPRIERHCKCLTKDHWYGRKGDLEFKAERYPAGFRIQFYQNINFENSYGGEYDFDKCKKMPYMIKLLFRNEVRYIKGFLESLGCVDNSKPVYKLATDKVKYHLVDSWHHPQKTMEEFELSNLDGQTCEASYNHTDRDKKVIYNGQTKYFRHWNGRLMRGEVYHNINNMWWVILNKTEYTNVASFELFNANKEDFKIRRLKADIKPESYLIRKEKIKESSTRELINELKRRGLKIAV